MRHVNFAGPTCPLFLLVLSPAKKKFNANDTRFTSSRFSLAIRWMRKRKKNSLHVYRGLPVFYSFSSLRSKKGCDILFFPLIQLHLSNFTHTDTHTYTDTQTHTQTHTCTHTQTHTATHRYRHTHTQSLRGRHTERLKQRETYRERDKETKRQNRRTETNIAR